MPRTSFEITQVLTDLRESRVFTLPTSASVLRGTALAQHPSDPDQAILANDDRAFLGFVTRDVTLEGATLADSVFPGRIETPFKSGSSVGIDSGALEVEVEGADIAMTSGSRAVSGSTAVGTLLSFQDGRVATATSNKLAYFQLAAQVTPVDSANTFRLRLRYIGATKA